MTIGTVASCGDDQSPNPLFGTESGVRVIERSGSDAKQPLGELLLARGLLSEEQLAYALAEQRQSARPLGEILVGLGYISAPTMAQALATQRGGVTKTEYGYAVGFNLPSGVTVATPLPPPVTTVAAPVTGVAPAQVPAAPSAVPASALRVVAPTTAVPVAVPALAPPPVEYAEPIVIAPGTVEPPVAFVDPTPQAPSPVVTTPADDSLRAELAAAVAAHDALAAQLAEARAESAAAREELHEVQRQLEDVHVQVASREAETAASVKDEADGLRAQLAELRGMADAVAAAEARAAELERSTRDAEARSAQVAEQLQGLTAERDELRESADAAAAAEAHAVELERTAWEAAEQVQALTAEREELRERVDALEHQRELMARHAAELERTADVLRAELAQRPTEPDAALRADKTGLEGRLEALESQLEHAVDMLGVLRGERESVEALERRLAAVAAEQRLAEETSATLAAQLEERTRQYETAIAELQRARAAAVVEEPEPAVPAEQAYLIFATLAGKYEILESVGAVPAIGDEIDVDRTMHAVVRVGGSPLPGSDVACVYTIPSA